jgi:hypothetical protein
MTYRANRIPRMRMAMRDAHRMRIAHFAENAHDALPCEIAGFG